MFFRINSIVNIVLSSLFILLGFFGLVEEKTYDENAIFALLFIFITFPLFIAFDIFCIKLNKYNSDKKAITSRTKTTGILLSVICGLLSVVIIFYCIKTYAQFMDMPLIQHSPQWPYFIAALCIIIFAAISTIFNIVYFSNSVKDNNQVYTDDIEKFGDDIN